MTTIFAPATAPGRAGVAIIRVSGPQAEQVFGRLECKRPAPRVATLATLIDNGEVIDRALLLWLPGPASFTGEDVAELHLHGSPAVLRKLLRLLGTLPNYRLAEPGEFSRRAFENGKMDLLEAEGLADLIAAETEAQARAALRQMEGGLSRLYEGWREELVGLLAHMEALIDFPDENLPHELEASLRDKAKQLTDAVFAHLADRRGERLREGVYVAIVGAPNVGKSSLINTLSRRDVAIVSPEAGTTRDALEAHLNLGGYAVTLCDTAGLREGAGVIESEGIARARARAKKADIVLALFEAGQAPDAATLALLDDRAVAVLTKIDLASPSAAHRGPSIVISTLTGEGIPVLLDMLTRRAEFLTGDGNSPALNRERHRAKLEACHAALARCLMEPSRPQELIAEDLRLAAQALGSITGRIRIEELMDKIFSDFCIGK